MSHGPQLRRWTWVVVASVVLGACASAPRHYALDTQSNACRQSPVQCAGLYASEAARAKAQMEAAAAAGATLASAQWVLDKVTQAQVEAVLKMCADEARSEVLLRRMGGRSPTIEECREELRRDSRGEPVTRAMLLGEEMHESARACAEERLGELLPGRFSLEPRYRYDKQTGQTTQVTAEEEAALLRRGLSRELLGTLKPDVVIHQGHPLLAQAVYDFKFPCGDLDANKANWRRYPRGHPHEGSNQKEIYLQALKLGETSVNRMLPRWGVLP